MRFLKFALAALICPVLFSSCSDDETENNIDVTFNAIPKVAGALEVSTLEGTPVQFTEVRNQETKSFPLDVLFQMVLWFYSSIFFTHTLQNSLSES